MDRRTALKAATALLLAGTARAQSGRIYRVGCLFIAEEPLVRPFHAAFVDGMREHGYLAGRNLQIEVRYAGSDRARLETLADKLVALKPDVLVSIESVAKLLQSRTRTIPIVLTSGVDPVAAGLVQSLSRPGTNVTGLTNFGDQLVAKHVELLAEMSPKLARIGLLNDPTAPAAKRFADYAREAAAAKGLVLTLADVKDTPDVEEAFAIFAKARIQGLVVVTTGRMNQFRVEVIARALALKLPSISALPAEVWADGGALATYAPSTVHSFRAAAGYVDRILKGAKPGDLPVERATRLELVVNLKTARAIGLNVPPAITLRADRVIE